MMLSSDENSTFAYAIIIDDRVEGSIGAFRQSNIHRCWKVFLEFEAPEYPSEGMAAFRASLNDKERNRHLGFAPTAGEQTVDGLRFTPVQYSAKADEQDAK